MKRFLCVLLSAVLMLGMLAGCGGKKNDTDDPATEPAASAPLEVQEDDTMHMNMLFSMMGTPDNGVTELLGDGNHQKYRADGSLLQREYDGVVYGRDIVFSVSYDEYGDVDEIDVDFDDSVSEDQLAEEISTLTGRERDSEGKWTAETAVVSLTDTADGICVTLTQFSAESEDDVEY
ncbi:MAG: hypothetical protein Q4P20_00695 [Eubacteriales bacterium]|nr:hypothetical protein [Eubacteriales bacterium]